MYCLIKNIDGNVPEENCFCNNSELNTIIAPNEEVNEIDEFFIIVI